MRRRIFLLLVAVSIAGMLAGGNSVWAAEISVARYCELSVVRLEFAKDLWEREGRSPNPLEEAVLLQWHGTTAEEYYAFASAHHQEVEAYLAAHPEMQAEIKRLSARIKELLGQAEGR